MHTVTAVLWDLGGVLCRFEPPRRARALARLTGRTTAQVDEVVDDELLAAADEGAITAPQLFDALRVGLDTNATEAELRSAWLEAFSPDEEVLALARRVVVPQGLLTNNGPPVADRFDENFPEVAAIVGVAVFASEIRRRKPDPAAYTIACDLLGAPPAQVLFVDDSTANVEGAASLGITAHHQTGVDGLAAVLDRHHLLGRDLVDPRRLH